MKLVAESETGEVRGELIRRLEGACDRFEEEWRAGRQPRLEDYLGEFSLGEHERVLKQLLLLDMEYGCRCQEDDAAEYAGRFPELSPAWIEQSAREVAEELGTRDDQHGLSQVAPRTIGDYELVEEIARGGMGIVFRARHARLGRLVALKMVRMGEFAEPSRLERFQLEAEAVAALDHPHIVPIYEVGRHGDRPYFTMKLIEGGSLADALREGRWRRGGRAAVHRAAEVTAAAARAVHHAHRHGILHRDLKPANILIDAAGRPHVSDFGLAKRIGGRLEDGGATHALTETNAIVGTPSYMAPEQAAGEQQLTVAADVYSLGAILFELLTGRPPFVADSPLGLVHKVVSDVPPPPTWLQSDVPRDIDTICLKCLQKSPADRYASAAELADDLERFLGGEPIHARPIPAWERAARWVRRRPAIAGMLATLALVIVVAFGLVTWKWRDADGANRRGQRALAAANDEKEKTRQALLHAETAHYGSLIAQAQRHIEEGNYAAARQALDTCDESFSHLRSFEYHYLAARLDRGMRIFAGHEGGVWSVAASADGARVVSAGEDQTIRVWDARSGELVWLIHHPASVAGVAISPGGERIASAGADGTLRLWSLEQDEPLFVAPGDGERLFAVAFSPDGRRVAAAGAAGIVRIHDAESGRELLALEGQSGSISSLAFHPGGEQLASGSRTMKTESGIVPGEIKIWDLTQRRELRTLPGHGDLLRQFNVDSVVYSPNGKRLASAGGNSVRLWRVDADEPPVVLRGDAHAVVSVAFIANGRQVVSAGLLGDLCIWDVAREAQLADISGNGLISQVVAVHPQAEDFVTAGNDGLVRLWRQESGRATLFAGGSAVDAPQVDIGSQGLLVVKAEVNKQHLTDAADPPDGMLPTASLAIWKGGKSQSRIHDTGIPGGITALAVGPGERKVACGGDGIVHVLDLATGNGISSLAGHDGEVSAIAWSGDGRRIVTGGKDETVRLWDAAGGKPRLVLRGHSGAVTDVEISHDGDLLASASEDRTVRVHVVSKGLELVLRGHDRRVNAISLGPRGELIAAGGDDGVLAWSVRTGRQILALAGEGSSVQALAFHHDGQRLAVLSGDGGIKVWDVATGRELLVLNGAAGASGRHRAVPGRGSWRLRFGLADGQLFAVVDGRPWWFPDVPWQR